MGPELKKIAKITIATAIFGSVFGVLLGALTQDYLLWIAVTISLGIGLGLALSYGFLPEK
ncbi:MAG: hypothetical protein GTO14_22100 [Anaerolineales bacterium]|nr:hypothetical protein [Anaerolineales bacterium]